MPHQDSAPPAPARLALLLAALAVGLVTAGAPRAERAGETDRSRSPYFFVESPGAAVDSFPLLGTEVDVQVAGVIADVVVRQTYSNDGTVPLHLTYTFPASTRAAVEGLTMTVGSRRVRAKIAERRAARREYEKARREGKNAALLEQERPNVFRMRLSNVMPGDRIEVELHYTELLVPADGVYEFVYPTVVGPRFGGEAPSGGNPTGAVPYLKEGLSTPDALRLSGSIAAGMPIDLAESPSHSLRLDWPDPARVDFSLEGDGEAAGNRDFVLRYRLAGGEVQTGLLLHEGEDEGFFLLTVQPPKRVRPEQIPPREYVFVVDVSGSMSGFPLDTSKSVLRRLIGGLRPEDSFNVLFFAGGSQLLAPSSLPATPENLDRALEMLASQRGGGGTRLLSALQRALALPQDGPASRSFLVVTDGYISVEAECFDWVRTHLGEANVFAFGIGSSVNRHLIEGLARAGQGEPFVVLDPKQAPETVERFLDYVSSPVLTNLRVEFHGFDAHDVEPAVLPDVLADRPIVVRGKWRGPAKGSLVVSGVGGGGDFQHVILAAEAASGDGHAALRSLWARGRIASLMDRLSEGSKVQEEITRLGLKYSLLTKFTSFLAVDERVRNPGGEAEEVEQPLPLPKGVSNAALGRGSEPALTWLLAGLALLLALRAAAARSPEAA